MPVMLRIWVALDIDDGWMDLDRGETCLQGRLVLVQLEQAVIKCATFEGHTVQPQIDK